MSMVGIYFTPCYWLVYWYTCSSWRVGDTTQSGGAWLATEIAASLLVELSTPPASDIISHLHLRVLANIKLFFDK